MPTKVCSTKQQVSGYTLFWADAIPVLLGLIIFRVDRFGFAPFESIEIAPRNTFRVVIMALNHQFLIGQIPQTCDMRRECRYHDRYHDHCPMTNLQLVHHRPQI